MPPDRFSVGSVLVKGSTRALFRTGALRLRQGLSYRTPRHKYDDYQSIINKFRMQ